METKSITKVWTIHLKEMKRDYEEPRQESARLWNDAVKLHKFLRKKRWGWSSAFDFQKHFKKKGYQLHSQTIQALISKIFSNIDTTRTNRKNGNHRARYPYKNKKYVNTIWKGQAIKRNNRVLMLPLKRGQKPIKIKISKSLQYLLNESNVKIVQVEMGYFKAYITLKEVVEVNSDVENKENIKEHGIAAMDLGLIHTAFLTNGKDTLALVGREMRSVNQNYNKQVAKITKKQSKCKKHSRRWKQLQSRKRLLTSHRKNFMRNFYHHVSNHIEDYCLKNKIHTLVFGDIRSISKNKKRRMSKQVNQAMSMISLGVLIKYVRYKLAKHYIEVEAINEAYTSQTCPVCGHRYKPGGRVYHCKKCNFKSPRDEVGGYNILNKYINYDVIKINTCIPTNNIKYLRPVKMGRSSGDDAPALPLKVA